jgi:hypothetical protein
MCCRHPDRDGDEFVPERIIFTIHAFNRRRNARGAQDVEHGGAFHRAAARHGEEPRLVGRAHASGAFRGVQHDGKGGTIKLVAQLPAARR